MDNRTVVAGSGGIGVGGLTFVVLMVLKLIGETSMSWFLVLTSIFWAPLIFFLGFLLVVLIFTGVIFLVAFVASIFQK